MKITKRLTAALSWTFSKVKWTVSLVLFLISVCLWCIAVAGAFCAEIIRDKSDSRGPVAGPSGSIKSFHTFEGI